MKKKLSVFLVLACVVLLCSTIVWAAMSNEDYGGELQSRANLVLSCLNDMDFEQLATLVHKGKGVTFSPYAYVEEDALNFSTRRIKELKPTDEFTWGAFDGSGEPIDLSVEGYFKMFVVAHDFTQAPSIGVDKLIGTGNTVSNLDEVFPGSRFVEYHFPGFDPQYEGMDWVSLRLVFEEVDGQLMLIGVIRDGWTS